jgi:chitinase
MKKLRSRMKASGKGTSMAIPASYWYLQNFDIKALEPEVDWFNLMSYDMHGAWDIENKWTGPWTNSHTNMTEIQQALDILWRNDINPSKVTMGMAFYSRSFTLTDPSCTGLGCRVSSGGNPGKCSDTVGVLLHPEIAAVVAEKRLSPVLDRTGMVKTVAWDNQWTTFDDLVTWRLKANAARGQCIQGFMVWAMSQDDKSGTNIKALNSALGRQTPPFPDFTPIDRPPPPAPVVVEPKQCRWTSCFEGCPEGFKEVQRDGHKEIMMDREQCDQHTTYEQVGFARFCCPSSSKLPTCTWRGHRNSGNCKPGCNDDEVEVGSLSTGCKKGFQTACCTKSMVTEAYGQCFWSDCYSNDDIKGVCGDRFMASSSQGWGGHKSCSKGKSRALCCSELPPPAFDTKCKWYGKAGRLSGHGLDVICEGACPKDHVVLARSFYGYEGQERDGPCFGQSAFCCPDPPRLVPRDDQYEEETTSSRAGADFQDLLEDYMDEL